MFYFVRHGKTDYTARNTKIYQGFGVNLSPLSETGVQQIQATARDPRLQGADLILCSPYTRALQTAAILSRELNVEIAIETDLHEWLANRNYIYEDDAVAESAYAAYEAAGGCPPSGEIPLWEDAAAIRARVLPVLRQYAHLPCVIVACHGMMIQAVTGKAHPRCGEIVPYELAAVSQ